MADRAQPLGFVRIAGLLAAACVAAITLGTLAVVALHAAGDTALAVSDLSALRFTVLQALVSAGLSVGLAMPVARALARRRFFGRGLLVLLLGAPFILPVIVAVLGLLEIFGRGGLINQGLGLLGLAPLSPYGFFGVVLAHVFFNLPLATRLLLAGWAAIPAERFRVAAMLDMRPVAVFWHLERPMLIALVPGIFATIFLLCLTSFAVALTLGGGPRATTIELAIYQAFRFDFDLSKAALLATLQFGLCAGTALIAWRIARPSAYGAGLDRTVQRWDASRRWTIGLDSVVLWLAALFLLAPIAMILVRGAGFVPALPGALWAAALRSIVVALASAVLTLGLSLPMAALIVRLGNSSGSAMIEGIGFLSLAASPLVIGTGLFLVVFPYLSPASIALPLTAVVNAVASLPFALRALIPAIRATESDYRRLAQSLNIQGIPFLRWVLWPRIRPAAGFAAGLAAALSMGDLGVIALFAEPDQATLPLMIYRLMAAYKMDAAQGASVVLLGLSLGLFWLFDRGGRTGAAT